MSEEAKLIQRALEGERCAQGELVRMYERRVYGLILGIVGNEEDARDLVQETMVKMLTNLYRYDATFPFDRWLMRIATNTTLDFLKRKRFEKKVFLPEDNLPREVADDASPSLDTIVAERITWQIVDRCMRDLPERYRAVLVLRYREGFSYSEIANSLSIPMGTVKVLLHRARELLKSRVIKEVGE